MEKENKREKDNFLLSAQGKEQGVVLGGYTGQVQGLLKATVAQETRRAYTSRLKKFFGWCQRENILPAFPAKAEAVAAYIAQLERDGAACSTVAQMMAALAAVHRAEGLDSPTDSLLVKKTLKGYRRPHGVAQHKKEAATAEVIRMMLEVLGQSGILYCQPLLACKRGKPLLTLRKKFL